MKTPTDRRFIDLSGRRFGRLVVKGFAGVHRTAGGNAIKLWECVCDCGNTVVVYASNLHYTTKSCGCLSSEIKHSRLVDLTGRRFGRLVVISFAETKKRHRYWNCKCDCGKTSVVGATALKSGTSTSCGCYLSELVTRMKTTHGLCAANNPIVTVWHSMLSRCLDPRNRNYKRYGGRGITVCERWQEDIRNFHQDMGERPSMQHSIDRIDNNGNYEPGNCRWVTMVEQNRNTSRNVLITHGGKTQCLLDWSRELGIKYATVRDRIKKGKPPIVALGLDIALEASRMLKERNQ